MASNPKILFECQSISSPTGTGVATYARNLIGEAKRAGYTVSGLFDVDAKLQSKNAALTEVVFFDAKRKKNRLRNLGKAWRILHRDPLGVTPRVVPRTGMVVSQSTSSFDSTFEAIYGVQNLKDRAAGHFMRYGALLPVQNAAGAKLLHTTHAAPMRLTGSAPTISTVHDIIPLRLPFATLDNKRYFYNLIRTLTKKLDHIVTVSEHSKRDLMSFFGVPEDRITNTYQAVTFSDKELNLSDDTVAIDLERNFKLEMGNYFLCVGAIEPKKNVSALIEAYVDSGTKRPLVLAGGLGWQYEQDVRQIRNERFVSFKFHGEDFRRERAVRHLNHVPRSALIRLIRGARALVFPSLYEGFGLPVLEAMTLGTPVISSNSSSLPEVCDDAAYLINPYDTSAIAAAIRVLDHDDGLRRDLITKGLAQAAKFTPEIYRERLKQLYAKLV